MVRGSATAATSDPGGSVTGGGGGGYCTPVSSLAFLALANNFPHLKQLGLLYLSSMKHFQVRFMVV